MRINLQANLQIKQSIQLTAKLSAIAITALTLTTTQAVACEISSGPQTTALVELYTSEGCSSCPPADRWLSEFIKGPNELSNKLGNKQAVALAFHVDYWDNLGWRDRFASPRFSQRQRDLVAAAVANGGGRTVYTPQLFINGADQAYWRDSGSVSAAIRAVNQRPAEAQLTLKLEPAQNKPWTATLSGNIVHSAPGQQIWLAVYQDMLSSDIKAGENSGAHLQHDRVVRQWLGPFQADTKGRIDLVQPIGFAGGFNPLQSGVAAFVEDNLTGKVLQAVSLPVCGHS